MDAKDFGRDDGSDGKAVEDVDEGLPDFDVAPTFALVVESIDWSQHSSRQSKREQGEESLGRNSPRVTFAHS